MVYIIDRIEGSYVVCESNSCDETIRVRRDYLPFPPVIGAAFTVHGGQFQQVDEARREDIKRLKDSVWR